MNLTLLKSDQSKITPSAPPKPYPTSSVQYGHPMNVAPPSYFNGSNHGQFQPTSRMPPPPPYNTNPMGQAMYSIYGYPVSHYPYTQPMVQPSPLPSNVAIVMPDGFDSMARFDGIARPNIPVI